MGHILPVFAYQVRIGHKREANFNFQNFGCMIIFFLLKTNKIDLVSLIWKKLNIFHGNLALMCDT
jgi:hypothetical protein